MLHYEISGTGKEYLVLLHGFMENLFIWEDMQEYLSKQFKLIKIDLPGHGRSEVYSDIHTMNFMAEKVKQVMDKLGVEKFHILGHSMGGYVALAFLEQFETQIKSVTLFFSTFLPDDEEKKEQRRKSFRIIEENFKAYVSAGVPTLFNNFEKQQLQSKIDLAKDIALSTDRKGAISAQKGMIERTEKTEILNRFEHKILLISGRHDTAIKLEETIKLLPNKANVKSYILDCGHNGHWEKPKICAEIINTELL